MNPHLVPTATFEFDREEAERLEWLPLAVRHKLDECGLRLTLKGWQQLPMATRRQLLRLPLGAGFALCASEAGAFTDDRAPVCTMLDAAEVARRLGCDSAQARDWLATSTAFARYALRKVSLQACQ